jgi:type IV pilus assembly protein PilE
MKRQTGFTLIELMVVIAIVAILAAIAVPAFNDQLRKSRRSEAARGLADLQLRQERWRANHASYMGSDSSAADQTDFGLLPVSPYYDFAFDSNASATTFTVKATAKDGQASDTACTPLRLEVDKGTVKKTPTTGRCWN